MPIDPRVFSEEWSLLCERFNRGPSKALSARYFDILSPTMSTAEFRVAAVIVLRESEFFPRPADFMAAIQPDPETEALDQWALCERIMEGERDLVERMTVSGQQAVRLLGGAIQLGQTRRDSVPFVRKDFLATYRELVNGNGRVRIQGPEVTPESRRIMRGLSEA